jgi:hypothetical protein
VYASVAAVLAVVHPAVEDQASYAHRPSLWPIAALVVPQHLDRTAARGWRGSFQLIRVAQALGCMPLLLDT